MGYKVKIKSFEGPLDLLVYLIESSKMDINDIKVSEITQQYLAYIEEMKRLDIELASEFMVLAATLINIKSKLLLPNTKDDSFDNDEIDTREKLASMLIEYKKFKSAAEIFSKKEEEASQIIEKPMEDLSEIINSPIEILSLKEDEFIKAFEKFLVRKKKIIEIKKNYDNVQRKKITAEERVNYIADVIHKAGDSEIDFFDTVKDKGDNYDVALSFTSVLELVKQRSIEAKQDRLYGQITLKRGQANQEKQ